MKDANVAQYKYKRWNPKYLKKTDADAEADVDQCKRALNPNLVALSFHKIWR